MWLAKFKLLDEGCIHATRNQKFNIQSYVYALTHYLKGETYFFISAHILVGAKEKKEAYAKDLEKDPSVISIERQGDLLIEMRKKKKKELDVMGVVSFFNPEIFLPKPALIDTDGWEYWEMASWNREALTKAINLTKKLWNGKLLKLIQTSKLDMFLPQFLPSMSEKQRQAMRLALNNGYYEFPREIELEVLAKEAGVSFSTFREHLRKAEQKIIPLSAKNFLNAAK